MIEKTEKTENPTSVPIRENYRSTYNRKPYSRAWWIGMALRERGTGLYYSQEVLADLIGLGNMTKKPTYSVELSRIKAIAKALDPILKKIFPEERHTADWQEMVKLNLDPKDIYLAWINETYDYYALIINKLHESLNDDDFWPIEGFALEGLAYDAGPMDTSWIPEEVLKGQDKACPSFMFGNVCGMHQAFVLIDSGSDRVPHVGDTQDYFYTAASDAATELKITNGWPVKLTDEVNEPEKQEEHTDATK